MSLSRPLAAVLCLLAATAAGAQTHTRRKSTAAAAPDADPNGKYPILSLEVRGNDLYTAAQILAVAGRKARGHVGPPPVGAPPPRRHAPRALPPPGFEFKQDPNVAGYHGYFEVVEETQTYAISFEDLPAPEDKLRAWLKEKDPLYGTKIPVTQVFLDHYTALLEQFLQPLGFTGHVKASLTADYSPDLTVLFRPSTPRPTVAEVYFTNTGDLMPSVLQGAVGPAAIGFGFTEARFRQILDASIRPLYEAKGHLHVTYPQITTAPARNVKGLSVAVKVDQGPVYKLMSFRAAGIEDIPGLMKWKPGDVANFDLIKGAQERFDDLLRRRGYLHASTKIERTVDDAKLTVSVVLQATPGPQYVTGKLTITGLDVISEPAVRKLWGLEEGKPFNASYPDHFLKVIRDEGIFDNLGPTHADTQVHEDTKTVDVTLYFEGVPKKKPDAVTPGGAAPPPV